MNALKTKIFIFLICIFLNICNGNADSNLGVEKVTINAQMKERIMNSSLKESLQRSDGKKIVAYLYAEDERREERQDYSCIRGELPKTVSKTGHYYIYLYDTGSDSFFPFRTPVFPGFQETTFNVDGADLIVLSGTKQKKSDVLFISQPVACYTNVFEAYGFSENKLYLKNYDFLDKHKHTQFNGIIVKGKKVDKLVANIVHNGSHSFIRKFNLYLSDNYMEIQVDQVKPMGSRSIE